MDTKVRKEFVNKTYFKKKTQRVFGDVMDFITGHGRKTPPPTVHLCFVAQKC